MINKTSEELKRAQKNDESLRKLYKQVDKPMDSKHEHRYYIENGILKRSYQSTKQRGEGRERYNQIVMPTDYRKDLLQLAHEVPLAGHLGINKTYDKLIRHFYWPGIKTSTKKFCNSCDTCQKAGKPKPGIAIAPLKPITIKERPFERVIMDCVGPLPRTKSGNRYLLTIMCASSRIPEAIPLRAISTKKVVESMINFFVKVGLPKVIQTDRGSNFMSNLFKRVIGQLGAKHVTSSPYHPQSQGALERFHATLKSMLRAHCTERQND